MWRGSLRRGSPSPACGSGGWGAVGIEGPHGRVDVGMEGPHGRVDVGMEGPHGRVDVGMEGPHGRVRRAGNGAGGRAHGWSSATPTENSTPNPPSASNAARQPNGRAINPTRAGAAILPRSPAK